MHEKAIRQHAIPSAHAGSTREGERNGNSARQLVPGWAYWVLTGHHAWTFSVLPPTNMNNNRDSAVLVPLDAVHAALRLGGASAVDAVLRERGLCRCPEVDDG